MEKVVKVIKANPFINNVAKKSVSNHQRVAAYARVSTDFEEQEDSFERQVDYYTRYINNNPNWDFVKVYSDPGISGTRAEKRPGFQEMIKDCHEGKIDRILVKSIARFARNTVDALKYIRELKELGISIYFESHNIDTSTPGGDVLITILAATAEEESRTISKNIKWSYQKKFEKGEFVFNYSYFVGYTKDENGKIVIVPEEAKVIRRIYNEYLFGYPIGQIAKRLNADNVPTASKKEGTKWTYGVVKSILTNEKYYGTALMGKTFKPDVLSKKRYKNQGQVEMYCLDNAFEGIIDKAQFDMVQQELARRKGNESKGDTTFGKFTSKYVFSKMIRCGTCGTFYVRNQNMRQNGKKVACWCCSKHFDKSTDCPQKGISEEAIQRAFVKCLNDLIGNYHDIKSVLEMSIGSVVLDYPTDKVNQLDQKIDACQTQILEIHKKKTKGLLDDNDYGRQASRLASIIDETKKEKDSIEENYSKSTILSKRVEEILKTLEGLNPTEEFDEEIFRRLIDSIVINDRTKITFKFKVGIERTIDAEIK